MNTILKALGLFVLVANAALAQQIGTIGVGDITVSADAAKLRSEQSLRADLDKSINETLVSTRKYTIVDHARLQQRLAAQGLTLEGYYANRYRESGLYKQAGLDYILKVNVDDMKLVSQKGGGSDMLAAHVDLSYTMFGVADLTEDFSAKVSVHASANIDRSNDDAVQGLIDRATAAAGKRLTQQLTTTLFPIRVVKIDEDYTITLNYGAGFLAVGDTILVYAKEADMPLAGSDEVATRPLAKLKILSAEKKFATGKVINGVNFIKKGLPAQLVSGN